MRCPALSRALGAAALAIVVSSPATAPATAAPGRSCQLVKDESGDAGLFGGVVTHDASLDIVSADIAADAKNLTVVIRVAKLATQSPPLPYGGSWSFHFATPEAAFILDAGQRLDGDQFELNHYTSEYTGDTSTSFLYEPVGSVNGTFDTTANEIRMTAPLAMFAPFDRLNHGSVLSKLLVISWPEWGFGEDAIAGGQADEAGGGGRASYRVGESSCVRVGA